MKIALIGCGGIARVHAASLRQVLGAELCLVVASRTPERAQQARQDLGADEWRGSYDEAFADPSIDAVLILTPHDQHAAQAATALRQGKHVLIEKAVTRTVAEAEVIVAAHRERPDLTLMVAENMHFNAAIMAAREAVAGGAIGELQMVVIQSYHFNQQTSWRREREAMGGGLLIDGGVHYLHALRRVAGEVESLFAGEPRAKFNDMEGEECAQLMMRLRTGGTATMNYSWGRHGNPLVAPFLFLGTKGSIATDLNKSLTFWDGETGTSKRRALGRKALADAHGFVTLADEFIRAIRERRRPAIPLTDGLRDVAIVEAAYRSFASGAAERVELPPWAEED